MQGATYRGPRTSGNVDRSSATCPAVVTRVEGEREPLRFLQRFTLSRILTRWPPAGTPPAPLRRYTLTIRRDHVRHAGVDAARRPPALQLPTIDSAIHPPLHGPPSRRRAGSAVWTDRENPTTGARAPGSTSSADQPAYVAVFRVDTDGRIRVLFPREPWGDNYVRGDRQFEVTGGRGRPLLHGRRRSRGRLPLRHRLGPSVRLQRHHPGRLLGLPADRRRPDPGRSLRRADRPGRRGSRPAATTTTTSLPTTSSGATTIPASSATTATPTPATTSGIPTAGLRPLPGGDLRRSPRTTRTATGRGRNVVMAAGPARAALRVPRRRSARPST